MQETLIQQIINYKFFLFRHDDCLTKGKFFDYYNSEIFYFSTGDLTGIDIVIWEIGWLLPQKQTKLLDLSQYSIDLWLDKFYNAFKTRFKQFQS